jgi:hypothetical protein
VHDAPEMPADEVVRIVDWLEGHEATYQINGGWGVDGGIQQGLGHQVYVHASAERARGSIGGRQVVVAGADRQRELRTGYRLREVDRHDLAELDQLQDGPSKRPSSTVAGTDPRIGTEDDG